MNFNSVLPNKFYQANSSLFDLKYIPLKESKEVNKVKLQKKIENCRNHIRHLETRLTYRRTNKATVRRLIHAHQELEKSLEKKIKANHHPEGFGKLYRAQMPRGLAISIKSETQGFYELKNENINKVFLLCKEEECNVTNTDLVKWYLSRGLKVVHFPTKDFGTWEKNAFTEKVNELISGLLKGEHIVVHCMGGIGRTGTIISAVISNILKLNSLEAIAFARKHSHPNSVETIGQKKLVSDYAEKNSKI